MLSKQVIDHVLEHSMQFEYALPCKHVCIDNFFANHIAEKIIEDFPIYENSHKKNAFGDPLKKAVCEKISEISPFYASLSQYFQSEIFHEVIRKITGIEDLLWGGETMYGGGTHENIQYAQLDAHVDHNYNDITMEHRRINVLIYLNKNWSDAWGGVFELHSDPKNTANDVITRYSPSFNRAVIMETTEKSWHGFGRINLPEENSHISRKSIALYFYTKNRPQHEIHGGHSTVYVLNPVPAELKVGEVITEDLQRAIYSGYKKRDSFLDFAHKKEVIASSHLAALKAQNMHLLSEFRVPALGWAKQEGSVQGIFSDHWLERSASGSFVAHRNITRAKLRFYLPLSTPLPITLSFSVDSAQVQEAFAQPGAFELAVDVDVAPNETMIFSYSSSSTFSGLRAGVNQDEREISVLLIHLVFE